MPASDETSARSVATGSAPAAGNGAPARRPSRLWLWFVAAFALQLVAWAAWLTIASQNRVQEIPVAPSR